MPDNTTQHCRQNNNGLGGGVRAKWRGEKKNVKKPCPPSTTGDKENARKTTWAGRWEEVKRCKYASILSRCNLDLYWSRWSLCLLFYFVSSWKVFFPISWCCVWSQKTCFIVGTWEVEDWICISRKLHSDRWRMKFVVVLFCNLQGFPKFLVISRKFLNAIDPFRIVYTIYWTFSWIIGLFLCIWNRNTMQLKKRMNEWFAKLT